MTVFTTGMADAVTPPPARALTWCPNLEPRAPGGAPQGAGLTGPAGEPRPSAVFSQSALHPGPARGPASEPAVHDLSTSHSSPPRVLQRQKALKASVQTGGDAYTQRCRAGREVRWREGARGTPAVRTVGWGGEQEGTLGSPGRKGLQVRMPSLTQEGGAVWKPPSPPPATSLCH